MIRKILLLGLVTGALLLTLLAGTQLLSSQSSADANAILAANKLYEAGHYSESIQVLEQLVQQGVRDKIVYFNLGNAYYQRADYARAILNYQRALQLAPRDSAIKNNLELAQERANVELPDVAPDPVSMSANLTGRWLTLNETALLALALWFIVGLLLFSWRLFSDTVFGRFFKYISVAFTVLLMIVLLSIGGRLLLGQENPEGIVVAPVVALQNAPGEQSDSGVEIKAGSPVELLEVQGDWIHLSGPGDVYNGWVPASSVETVAGIAGGNQQNT